MDFIEPYTIAIQVVGLAGLTLFLQLIVVDIFGLKAKDILGQPISADHSDFHFRASKALSHTNESVSIFILFVGFAILSSANPDWLNMSAIVYLVVRVAHMFFYYVNLKLLRSLSFVVSLIGLMAVFVVGVLGWL